MVIKLSEWDWITNRNSPVRNAISLGANLLMLVLLGTILMDYDEFKHSIDCQAYQQVIEAAKQCTNGVRADLCHVEWVTKSFDIINVNQTNLTDLMGGK